MENSIFIGLSRQMALRKSMDIISHNVANMNTTGFRAQDMSFHEYVSETHGQYGKHKGVSMVDSGKPYLSAKAGPIKHTGSDFDIALNGPGFLEVKAPDGTTAYTRAGNLTMNADGTLTTRSGHILVGDITIPENSTAIAIDENGIISNQDGEIGKLSLVEFEDVQSLKPLGDTLYSSEGANKPAEKTRVLQGSLEGSNVNGVVEMTKMISTLRNFQSSHKMVSEENDLVRKAIQKLTKV